MVDGLEVLRPNLTSTPTFSRPPSCLTNVRYRPSKIGKLEGMCSLLDLFVDITIVIVAAYPRRIFSNSFLIRRLGLLLIEKYLLPRKLTKSTKCKREVALRSRLGPGVTYSYYRMAPTSLPREQCLSPAIQIQ